MTGLNKETIDAIVDNLHSLGYGAKPFETTTEQGKAISRIYLETGSKHIKAHLDCAGEVPSFYVNADFPEGHEKQTYGGEKVALDGDDLDKHNAKMAMRVRKDLATAVLAAYVTAVQGADIDALKKGFYLENRNDSYKPYMGAEDNSHQKNSAPKASPASPSTAM